MTSHTKISKGVGTPCMAQLVEVFVVVVNVAVVELDEVLEWVEVVPALVVVPLVV